MSVVRRDKRKFRRLRPRRVGAGVVALLALGTGAGCSQSLLRPDSGPGLAAESLGLVDAAIPSRKIAWVGADGRHDLPYPAVLPSREPANLNVGLATAVSASGTTWNGWKVPAAKSPAAVAASTPPVGAPSELPDMRVATITIPLPVVRRAGVDPEVETLLAASRETRIAPPLTHRVIRPEAALACAPQPPVVPLEAPVAATASPREPGVMTLPTTSVVETPAPIPEFSSSQAPPADVVELEKTIVVETRSVAEPGAEPEAPAEPSVVVAESKAPPVGEPVAPVPAPGPLPAPTTLPLDATTAVKVSQVDEARPAKEPGVPSPPEPKSPAVIVAPVDLPVETVAGTSEKAPEPESLEAKSTADSPVPPPAEIDPLTAASETSGIPLPKKTAEEETVPAILSEPVTEPFKQAPVAGASPGTTIPMPFPIASRIPEDLAPLPVESTIPTPNPAESPEPDPSATVSSTTDIPMPVPFDGPKVDSPNYPTTDIPMPVTVESRKADPLAETSRETQIPMPVPVETSKDEAPAEVTPPEQIPMPIPVATPAGDPVAEASRETKIPMPVPVAKPLAVLNPQVEASRTTQIPLPIPPDRKP